MAVFLLIGAAVLSAVGQLLLKYGSRQGADVRTAFRNRAVMTAIVCFAACLPMVVWALRRVDFSFYYATTGLNYVFVILLSKPLFGERLDRLKLVGSALIVSGVVLYGW